MALTGYLKQSYSLFVLYQPLDLVVDQAAEAGNLLQGAVVTGTEGAGEGEPLAGIEPFDAARAEQFATQVVLVLTHLLHRNGQMGQYPAPRVNIFVPGAAHKAVKAFAGPEYLLDNLVSYLLTRENNVAYHLCIESILVPGTQDPLTFLDGLMGIMYIGQAGVCPSRGRPITRLLEIQRAA